MFPAFLLMVEIKQCFLAPLPPPPPHLKKLACLIYLKCMYRNKTAGIYQDYYYFVYVYV